MNDKKERKKIKINSLATPRTLTINNRETKVVQFRGTPEGETTEYLYEVWGELVDHLSKNAEIDAEISHVLKDGGEILRVTQIYDAQGKPLRGTTRQSYSRSQGKSPEDQASIESQVAAYVTKDLWVAGKISDEHPLVTKLLSWIESRLGLAKPKLETPKPSEPKAEPKKELPIDDSLRATLKKVVTTQGYTKADFEALLSKFNVKEVKDLTMAQGDKLLELCQRREGLPKKEPTSVTEEPQLPF